MNLQDFINYLADSFENTDSNTITKDTLFQDLEDFCSLTTIEIIAVVRTKLGKTINAKEILNCKTIGELYNFISSK